MDANFTPSGSPHMSEDVREYFKAFLKARVEFPKTGKSGTNTGQKYDYSKIEDIYNAVIPGLAKNDIAVWHFAYPWEALSTMCLLETRLIHQPSGQWVSDKRFLMCEKPGNQAIGIANTYMRKYAVLSLCGIATEDDDGEAEEQYIKEREQSAHKSSSAAQPVIRQTINLDKIIGQAELTALNEVLDLCSNKDWLITRLLEFNKVDDICYLPSHKFDNAMKYIENYGKGR